MTARDFLTLAFGNLWRMKLRAFLTISGVVIAIGAFVSMLSFGAGMRKNVEDQFDRLGLFTAMFVYPPRDQDIQNSCDTMNVLLLDSKAVEMLSQIPGVRLAYPFHDFSVTAIYGDTTVTSDAQAIPLAAMETKLYSQIESGNVFESDSAAEVVVTREFLKFLQIEDADSVVGQKIIVTVSVASIDSGLVHIIKQDGEFIWDRFSDIRFDSLMNDGYRDRIIKRELSGAVGRFIDGFLNARKSISDTLTISGVLKRTGRRVGIKPIIITVATGHKFNSAGFSGDLPSLISGLSSGSIFPSDGDQSGKTYSKITLDLQHDYPYAGIRDSIETLGYSVFSYAEEFEEIRKFFTFFYLGLGVVGFIALTVAALGIINTMVMSITERRREIGVLRSLGANESDIRLLFLVESALIGSIGAVVGIMFGWSISRLISFVAREMMKREGVDAIEMFALPLWLIGTAFLFGLLVSLAAGYYPSSRAARVDPVQALRGE